jgi:hypothetical protein
MGMRILETKKEAVTDDHRTPWLKQWTMHTVEIPEEEAEFYAERLSETLEREHPWYADFKNEKTHYIVYRSKVFKVDRRSEKQYREAKDYGVSLGIAPHQVDFAPDDNTWKH